MTNAEIHAYFKAGPAFIVRDDGTRKSVFLPIFIGPEGERLIVWRALNRADNACQWYKAAIAASVVREQGQRTDRGRVPTALQTFCAATGNGPKHVRRISTAHTVVVAGLRDPGVRKLVVTLLTDDFFSFKHWVIATNHSTRPFEALVQAKAAGLSANALERALDGWARNEIINDGTRPVRPDDDDDDPLSVRPLPTRVWRLPLTKAQHRAFGHQLLTLEIAYGTTTPNETILMAVAKAFESVERQQRTQPRTTMTATA